MALLLYLSKYRLIHMFMVSMVTLLVALMIVFFGGTDVVTRILMSTAVGILLIATAILLWLDWDNHSGYHGEHEPQSQAVSILDMFPLLPCFKSIVSSVQNQWHESRKGILRLRRLRKQNKSENPVATKSDSSEKNA